VNTAKTPRIFDPPEGYQQCTLCRELKEVDCFRQYHSGSRAGMRRWTCRECDARRRKEMRAEHRLVQAPTPLQVAKSTRAYKNWADLWRK
jgi:hypothetical protein